MEECLSPAAAFGLVGVFFGVVATFVAFRAAISARKARRLQKKVAWAIRSLPQRER